MTTTAPTLATLESFCPTRHPRGEFDEIAVDSLLTLQPEGYEDAHSETGWEFQITLGFLTGEHDDTTETLRTDAQWIVVTHTFLSEALDVLIVRCEQDAEALSTRFRSGFYRVHDVRPVGV